jgi:hypothetical protein
MAQRAAVTMTSLAAFRRLPPRAAAARGGRAAAAAAGASPKAARRAAGREAAARVRIVALEEGGADLWRLDAIVELIRAGAVGILPTDSFPALVADVGNKDAVRALYGIIGATPTKALSILCRDFADVDKYTLGFPRSNAPGQPDFFRVARQARFLILRIWACPRARGGSAPALLLLLPLLRRLLLNLHPHAPRRSCPAPTR